MTRIMLESSAAAQLRAVSDPVEVCDESGGTLGYFHPVSGKGEAGRVRSPFTREELEGFRQQRTGRPLAEILKNLGGL